MINTWVDDDRFEGYSFITSIETQAPGYPTTYFGWKLFLNDTIQWYAGFDSRHKFESDHVVPVDVELSIEQKIYMIKTLIGGKLERM